MPFEYAVICKRCGTQELSEKAYIGQLTFADRPWLCPKCGDSAEWDDESCCMNDCPRCYGFAVCDCKEKPAIKYRKADAPEMGAVMVNRREFAPPVRELDRLRTLNAELLEALKTGLCMDECITDSAFDEMKTEFIQQARAALAKAESCAS